MIESTEEKPHAQRCELCKRTGCYFHPDMAKPHGLDVDHPITIPVFIERFGCARFYDPILGQPISRKKLETFFRSAKETTQGVDDMNRFLYITGRNILADAGLASLILGDFDEDTPQQLPQRPSHPLEGEMAQKLALRKQIHSSGEPFYQSLSDIDDLQNIAGEFMSLNEDWCILYPMTVGYEYRIKTGFSDNQKRFLERLAESIRASRGRP